MDDIKDFAPNLPTQYLRDFFAEKDIPYKVWELTAKNGTEHVISNVVVIEHMANCGQKEAAAIEKVLRKIDFANGSVNHFLQHLAQAIADRY